MSKSEVDSMINQTERDILLDGIKRHVRQLPAQAKVETKCPDKCGRIAADLDIVQKRERGVVQRIDDILNKITATEKEIDEIKSIQKDLGLSEQGKAKLQKAETNLKVYEGFQKEIPGLEKELLDLDAKETALENQLAACERQCLCEKGKGFADQASCERACPRESEFHCFFQIPLTEGGTGCWNCIREGYGSDQLMYCEKYGPAGYTDFDTCKLNCPKMTSYCRGESLKILAGDKIGDVKRKEDVEKTRCFKCAPRTGATGGTPRPGAAKVEEGSPEVQEKEAATPTALASETQITLGGELRARGTLDGGLRAGLAYNEFIQYHANGQRSNKDQGWVWIVGGDLGANFGNVRLSMEANVETSRDLKHAQYMPSGVADDVNTKILGFDGRFLGQYYFTQGDINLVPTLGIDYWNYERHVYAVSDFEERWEEWDVYPGMLVEWWLSREAKLFVEGGVFIPFSNSVRVDSSDVPGGVKFDPGKRPGYNVEAGFQFKAAILSFGWSQRNFAQSSPVFIPSLGGSFTENKTRVNRFAVSVGLRF